MSRVIKLLEKKLLFRGLMEASGPAVYCLINERDKRVYILATSDLIKSLASQSSMLGRRSHPLKELKRDKKNIVFKLLETIEDTPDVILLSDALFISKYKWIKHYSDLGYTLYNSNRSPKYKTRVSYTETYKARVDLVTGGRKVFPVKEFDTEAQATAFIANNSVFDLLILAKSNKLT